MKRIILAATIVLLFTQPAFAYSRLFYRFTVRSNYVKKPISTDQPSTPAPTPSILPTEDGLVDEVGHGGEKENIGQVEEIVAEEPGVVNTPEGEEIVSAIIGPFDDVELMDTSSTPPISSARLSTSPAEEESVRVEEDLAEELGVVNTPEEKKEENEIVVEEQSVEMPTEEIEEEPAVEPEEIEEEAEESATEIKEQETTPAEAGV